MADLEQLLAPVTAEQPCGPDRSDNRLAIEQPFERPESATGDEAASDTNWGDVIEQIVNEFGRTKDLWLAIYLCRAGVYAKQWAWIELGASALAGLVERYWDNVHPNLEEYGVTARAIACNSLANRPAFINPLLRVPVIAHIRLGAFSAADFERLAKGREAEADFAHFQKTLTEVGPAQLQAAYDVLGRIEAALQQADKLFGEKTGGSETPDFALTYETLGRMKKAVAQFHSVPGGKASAEDGAAEAQTGAAAAGDLSSLRSRADVIRAIDAITQYYRQHEPSSPIPVVLERARGWVNLPFMEVLADIAPETVADAKRLLMKRPSDE